MKNWQIKASLFLNYFVFAILLNSVGTVILQVQNNYGVTEGAASVLEAFKDLSIAVVSFLVSSYITRIGYKRAMLIALGFVTLVCFMMPVSPGFWAAKLLFAAVGSGFALIKMSVYSTIGLVTSDKKEHISLMSFIESFFMVGILTGYFVFSYFVDDNNPQSTEWLKVYYLLGTISLAAFVLLLSAKLDESSVRNQANDSMVQDFGKMFQLMVTPLVLVFVLCAFFYVLIEQSIMSWLPTFNSKVLQLPTALSIEMASILAGATALGRFLAGIVMKKLNWHVVLTGCLLLAAVLVVIAIPLAKGAEGRVVTGWGDAPLGAFVFPLIGLFLAPVYPAINSLILSALPVQKHGLMSGLIIIFSALGGTTGSIITGNIFGKFGGQTAFYFSLVPIGILLTGLYFFKKLQAKA
ncbi:MAG: MFS transporter [Lewinellaceae bacterium]|jgi:FHS family glucose/mannose:H+ symporter-like MFS transporter|nr:MFS transporter [Lewinellaceae bacterium]